MGERSIRHFAPAALLALFFLLGDTGAAQAAGPVSLAPAEGERFLIGAPVDFAVHDDTVGKSVYVHISPSPATDAEGLIGHDVWTRGMSGAPDFTARWETSGLQMPGTYYWQAHRIDCFTPSYPD